MSTPATFKRIEEQKQRKATATEVPPRAAELKPLSDTKGRKIEPKPLGEQDANGDISLVNPNRSNRSQQQYRQTRRIDFTDDMAGGKQYTSFEKQNKAPRERKPADRPAPRQLHPQLVEDVPIDVDTDDYKVIASTVTCFSGRSNYLSNLFATPVLIDGHEYSSVEHYYQACKLYMLGGAHLAAQIRRVSDPGYVKVYAKKLLRGVASYDQIEEWKRQKAPAILKHAILQKFMQHSQLREKLLATGDAILAHSYDRDNVFATGCDEKGVVDWAKEHDGQIIKIPTDLSNVEYIKYVPLIGNGKNLLGAINMQVRRQIHHFKSTQADSNDPVMQAMFDTLNLG